MPVGGRRVQSPGNRNAHAPGIGWSGRDMKIRNLDTFYWVISLGSFVAAAQHLNLSQPAVSARVRTLEQDLGIDVFAHSQKKMELTPAGHKLFSFAERLMNLEAELLSEFSDTLNVAQSIRVGASETLVSTWLPDFMNVLSKSYTRLSFYLQVDSTGNLAEALMNRKIDLALLMGPLGEAGVINHNLCGYEMIFAARRDVAQRHEKWTLREIAGESVITFAITTKPGRHIRDLLVPHARGVPNMMTSTSLGALVRMAKSGMGICAIPKAVIETELAEGALVALDTPAALPVISFTASYISGSSASMLADEISRKMALFLG